MKAAFFYRTYVRMSDRSKKVRLLITPLGFFTIAVCLLSGLAGLNIFVSDLYKLFSFSFSLILISYLSRNRKKNDLEEVAVRVLFGNRYNAGNEYTYSIILLNNSGTEIKNLELIPSAGSNIPNEADFLNIHEPEEEKRNFWDRNIYYFRWIWHVFRLYKIEFRSVPTGVVKPGSSIRIDGTFRAVKRGRIDISGCYIIKKDIFGIFSAYRFQELNDRFFIYPAKSTVNKHVKNSIMTDFERKSRSQSATTMKYKTGDFVGLRDYIAGDPVRNIHWKTWAKRDKPAVVEKGIETIKAITFLFVNSISESSQIPDFEDSLSFLYSMIREYESDNFEVSLFYLDSEERKETRTAENEKGNFPKLYGVISDMSFFFSDPSGLLAKASKVLNINQTIVISPVHNKKIERFCEKHKLLLFVPENEIKKDKRIFSFPKINNENYQMNLP